jgi:stage III sporulation protein SpoIIIAA
LSLRSEKLVSSLCFQIHVVPLQLGVQLIGTAHGQLLENLIKNPTLTDLVGGVQAVTLGDDEARSRGCQKSIMVGATNALL